MPVYDDEISKLEGEAADGAPSSTGAPSGLSGYNPSMDADSTQGGRHTRDADQALAKQLQQKEAQSAGTGSSAASDLAKGLASPGFTLGGVGGAALKLLARSFWGNNKRKAATLGGSSSAMVVLGLIWIFNFSAGPFAFIHLGDILSKKFEPFTDQSKSRMEKVLFRTIFDPPEDVKNPVGDNRLSFLGYLMKNRTLNQLKAKGITPQLKSNGYSFDGFTIDPNAKDSPFTDILSKGDYNDARVIESIKDALDPSGKLNLEVKAVNGKILVQGDETFLSNTGIKAMSDVLTTGESPAFDPVWDFIRVRNLSRWSIAGNFHWLAKADAKVTSVKDAGVAKGVKGAAWLKEKIYDPIKRGLSGNSSDGVAINTTDSNGNVIEGPVEGEGAISEASAKSFLTDPKGFASGVGIASIAAAVVCILKVINETVGVIRWFQIDRPMQTMASSVLSIASQIKSGQDIDISEVDAFAGSTFNTRDASGNVTSTFYDSMPLRSTAGDTGGTDVSQGLKDMMQDNNVPWLSWTKSDPVKILCSGPVTIGLGVINIGLMLLPGVGVINAAVGAVAFSGISLAAIHFLPDIIAGQGINIEANGAEWGGYVDYGSRMLASQHAISEGGTALTTSQENQLVAEANAQNREQFHNESLADRIFNASDYRSVVGSMIDRAGVYNAQDLVAKIGSIPNILGSLFSLPASIISASAHADSTYTYPFPMIGFSDADINNPIVSDPYGNADKVSAILDSEESSGDHTYIDKALNCFGVAISKGDQGWDAVPTTANGTDGQDHTFGPDPYDAASYDKYNCGDQSDTNWLRIRIWIFDLSNMEGYACSQGDETSCENSGFNTASATGTPGNVTFVSQNDPQWASTLDYNGKTMSNDGCVLAVESMVISTLTHNFVSPVDLNSKYAGNNDPYSSYSLKATGMWVPGTGGNQAITPATQDSMQKVISTLQAGGLVAVYAKNIGTQPFWGTDGHEELIRGITADGQLLVYDPWDMPDTTNHFIPDASYPNDHEKHSLNAYPQSNFIQPGISFDFITKGN